MEVYLDTTDRKSEKVVLKGGFRSRSYKTNGTYKSIFALLEAEVKNPKEIAEVAFNKGPGSFNGLRVGAAIANALRYSLGLAGPKDILEPEYGKELN